VFIYCHSDCHQLKWMDDVCPAPKTLMMTLAKEKGWIDENPPVRNLIKVEQV